MKTGLLASIDCCRRVASVGCSVMRCCQRGSQLSQEVDGMLGEIVEAATRFTGLVTHIATSTKEQSDGIQQVTRSVAELQAAGIRNTSAKLDKLSELSFHA